MFSLATDCKWVSINSEVAATPVHHKSIVCHWNVANFTHNWPNLRPLIATTQKGNVVGIFSKEEIRNMYTVDNF